MPNTIDIEIDEKTLKDLVVNYLSKKLNGHIDPKDIKIETKSAQNYRSEWEKAKFRARISVII